MTYERARQGELPAWLSDPIGKAFQASIGAAQDEEELLLKKGVLLRTIDNASDDSLDFIGGNFDEPRFADESNDHYRARLPLVWDWKAQLGTKEGIINPLVSFADALDPSTPMRVEVKEDWQWHAAHGAWYSRIWVLLSNTPWLPLTPPFQAGFIGAPNANRDNIRTLGSTATRAHVVEVKKQILKRKAPHAYPIAVLVFFEDSAVLGAGLRMPFQTGAHTCVWPMGRSFLPRRAPFKSGGFLI